MINQFSNHPASCIAWYCVRTQPKREAIAASQITMLGVEVFAPRIRFQRRTPRGKVWFEESLFPGYIFSRFDVLKNLRTVSSAVGVRGLVRFAGECAVVPDEMIEMLCTERFDEGPVMIEGPSIQAGNKATVVDGALRGLHAVVTQVLPGGERVKILLDMLGTAVTAEVFANTLELAP